MGADLGDVDEFAGHIAARDDVDLGNVVDAKGDLLAGAQVADGVVDDPERFVVEDNVN